MLIFRLSAAKTMRLLIKWSYFAQKYIKFHPQPSKFEKFPGEKPRTLAYRGREMKAGGRSGMGLKGSYVMEWMGWKG